MRFKNVIKKAVCAVVSAAVIVTAPGISEFGIPVKAAPGGNENWGNVNWQEEEEDSTYSDVKFSDSYKKLGDKLVVENAPEGASYIWEVYSYVTGEMVESVEENTGTFQTKEEYNECMITCMVDYTVMLNFYCSTLPVVCIESDDYYYDVKKEEYSDAAIRIIGNEQFSDESVLYDGEAQIKLRGNSTAYRDKRPFKIKLDKKANLLGLGDEEDGSSYKSKHWVLLANDIDHSLIRNKLLYDFSGAIGTEFYFKSTNVALLYNGEYKGVYQLCEHRRVDEGRIDIEDWVGAGEEAAEAIAADNYIGLGYANPDEAEDAINAIMYQDYSWMDTGNVTVNGKKFNLSDYGIELPGVEGGYLAEMDFYSIGSDTQAGISTAYGQPLYFSAPEAGADAEDIKAAVISFRNTNLFKYAQRYTQTFEYALHSPDFTFYSGEHKYLVSTNAFESIYDKKDGWTSFTETTEYSDEENEGKHYSELFDMDSLVNNFIFVEYAMNWDSMKNSFFYYKKNGETAKIGPQWDFDWCWGNINMYNINTYYPTKWQTTIEEFTVEQPYQSYNWNRLLIKDPYFVVRVYEKYHEIRNIIEEMICEGGLIDRYYEELSDAGRANDFVWKYTYTPEYYNGAIPENFEDSINSIKEFLEKRVDWMDSQFKSVERLMYSLGYYEEAADINITVEKVDGNITAKAEVTNTDCKSVVFQINGAYKVEAAVENGEAVAVIPQDKLIDNKKTMNVIVAYEKNAAGGYIENQDLKPSGNYEYVAKSAYAIIVTTDTGITSLHSKPEYIDEPDAITGVNGFEEAEESINYILVGDGSVKFTVEALGDIYGEMVFGAGVYDTDGRYYVANTDGDSYFYNATVKGDYSENKIKDIIKGHIYTVNITRIENDFKVTVYDETAGDMTGEYLAGCHEDFTETVNIKILALYGSFKVSKPVLIKLEKEDNAEIISNKKEDNSMVIIVAAVVAAVLIIIGICVFLFIVKRKKAIRSNKEQQKTIKSNEEQQEVTEGNEK